MQKWPFKYGFIWSSACTIDALSAYLMHSYSCDRPGSCRLVYMGECALETHHAPWATAEPHMYTAENHRVSP